MSNEIEVFSLDRRLGRWENEIRQSAFRILNRLGQKKLRLAVYLLNRRQMESLNRSFSGQNRPANVLSFSDPGFPPVPDGSRPIGEVYLCPPLIRQQKEDLNRLLIHGLLHLFGFNHDRIGDRIKMEKLEENLNQWLRHQF